MIGWKECVFTIPTMHAVMKVRSTIEVYHHLGSMQTSCMHQTKQGNRGARSMCTLMTQAVHDCKVTDNTANTFEVNYLILDACDKILATMQHAEQ